MKAAKCRYSHNLNAYLDAELSDREYKQVQLHLKECPVCQKELRELMKLNNFLNTFQQEEVPEYLTQKILADLPESRQELGVFGIPRRLANLSAAACLILSFAAGILFSDMAFNNSSTDNIYGNLDLTSNTLYSYLEGAEK